MFLYQNSLILYSRFIFFHLQENGKVSRTPMIGNDFFF